SSDSAASPVSIKIFGAIWPSFFSVHLNSRRHQGSITKAGNALWIGFSVQMKRQIGERIKHQVGRIGAHAFKTKPVGDTARPNPSVARRTDVDSRVANHHGLVYRGAEIAQKRLNADGIRLLATEAIASVNETEVTRSVEALENFFAEADGLVRQHGHAAATQCLQSFAHAGV